MRVCLLLALLCFTALSAAEDDPILKAVEAHAYAQATGHGNEISVEAGPLDNRRLPACSSLETYTPTGARNIGRSHVGVRCLAPVPWNIIVPVRIAVFGNYVTARRALLTRQRLNGEDLAMARGDLAQLPTGTLTDPAEAIGKTLKNSLAAGRPLRADQLISPPVIRQGQQVRVHARGEGYAVRAEGKALNNAAAGDVVRVRMPSGRTISGIAEADGSILLKN